MVGACDTPSSTYSPPAVVNGAEVASWLGLQPDQASKASLWLRKFLWEVWRIVLKRRNVLLAAIRSPRGTQVVEVGVRGLGTTMTLGLGCLSLGLPLQRHVCGQQMFTSVLNTNRESYDGRETIVRHRQQCEGNVRCTLVLGGREFILPAFLEKTEGFHASWVSSMDGRKGRSDSEPCWSSGCLDDVLHHASMGLGA